jgi:hypothetical protein
MRKRMQSQNGQLLLPILALIILFGLFLAGFLRWCRTIYWQMRVDMVAEAVAISASRAQAEMLNNLAFLQGLENVFLQKVALFQADVAHMQTTQIANFELNNQTLRLALNGFNGQTMAVAQAVARANGIGIPAVPSPTPGHHLEPQKVNVFYFTGPVLNGEKVYEKAYFLRKWGPGIGHAQPDHRVTWRVITNDVEGIATALVWLDLLPESVFNNGGFPGKDLSWIKNIGIQCFFPQFNARLISTQQGL